MASAPATVESARSSSASSSSSTSSSTTTNSPSADSFIGSLISLTSKSEIRYEGVLFSINTQESSIGLSNVRSFGTEARKKDGPQVPASDRIYEFILFRGSDIKDLQVKAPPSAQNTPIHSDPAIIQSHYPQPPSAPKHLSSSGSGISSDVSSHAPQLGQPRPPFQGNVPMYQPGGSIGSWGSGGPPTANNSGLSMPLYWQGYYSSPAGLPHLQPPHILQPPSGLQMPPSMQQSLHYPGMSSLPSGTPSLPNFPSPLLPTTSSLGSMSSMFSSTASQSQASSLPIEPPPLLLESKNPGTSVSPTSLGTNASTGPLLPSVPESITSLMLNKLSVGGSNTKTLPTLNLVPQTTFPSASVENSSRPSQVENLVPLITPDDLIQPNRPSILVSSQTVKASNKDLALTQDSVAQPLSQKDEVLKSQEAKAEVSAPQVPLHATAESKEPILPLPKPVPPKMNGAAFYNNRGRGRGRRNMHPRPVTQFTEDFDFTAMNEKFNKDEVWDHLGKSKNLGGDNEDLKEEEDGGGPDEDDPDSLKPQMKPIYVKDDFFDSLSCDSLNRGARNGRPNFSEQRKIDTETFGDFPRHGPSRGGGYGYRGSRPRGSYHGRGYGYAGRGRGHTSTYRLQ